MKASVSEVKRMITSCVHGACLDRDYINEQDLSKVTALIKPYSNVKVDIEKSKHDDGYLELVIRVDAFGGGGMLRYEIRSSGRKKKYYDPQSWIDEIEKWDALLFL